MEERLATIPTEADLLREQLEKELMKKNQLLEELSQEKFDRVLEKLQLEEVANKERKEKEKIETYFQLEREENLKLRQLSKGKRAATERIDVGLEKRLREETDKVEHYKRASLRYKERADGLTQEKSSLQEENESLKKQVKDLERSLFRHRGSTAKLKESQEKNQILMEQMRDMEEAFIRQGEALSEQEENGRQNQILLERIEELEDKVSQLKDQHENLISTLQVRPTPTPEQLFHVDQVIWTQRQVIREGKQMIQEIAQKVQLIAEDAEELHDLVDDDTEEGERIAWILREVTDLGARLERFV